MLFLITPSFAGQQVTGNLSVSQNVGIGTASNLGINASLVVMSGNVGIGSLNPVSALDMGTGGITLGGVTNTSWPLSGITFTDGVNTVSSATQLTITGGTVGGTTPNATLTVTGGGSGTVTSLSVASANGQSGTVANATTTPVITLNQINRTGINWEDFDPNNYNIPNSVFTTNAAGGINWSINTGTTNASSNWDLSNWWNLNYRPGDTQVVNRTFSSEAGTVAYGYVFLGDNQTPSTVIRYKEDDLTSTVSATAGADGDSKSMTFDKVNGMIYDAMNDGSVYQLNPLTMSFTRVITNSFSGPNVGITNDGTSLYIVQSSDSPAVVYKYLISTFAQTSTLTLTGNNTAQSVLYDGTNLYVTSATSPAWIARIPAAFNTFTVATLTSCGIAANETAIAPDYLFIGCETSSFMDRVRKSDLSQTLFTLPFGSYGTWWDGQTVWGAQINTTNTIFRFNPITQELETILLPSGFTAPYTNKFYGDGNRLFITNWNSGAGSTQLGRIGTTSNPVQTVNFNTNVGIGQPTPAAALDVVGNINASNTITASTLFTGPQMILTGAGSNEVSFGGTSQNIQDDAFLGGNILEFQVNGLNTMQLNGNTSPPTTILGQNSGNVGIGTTIVPSTLYVAGTTQTQILQLPGINGITQCLHANSTGIISGTGSDCGSGGGSSQWISGTGGNIGIATTSTVGIGTLFGNAGLTVMNGNVGIGTWNPGAALIVNGNIGINGPLANAHLFITQDSGNSNASGIELVNSGSTGTTRLWEDSSNNTRLDGGNGATTPIILNGSGAGSVSIGTTGAGKQLNVSGAPGTTISVGVQLTNLNGHTWDLLSNGSAQSSNPNGFSFFDASNSAFRFNIDSNGNIGLGTATPSSLLEVGTQKLDVLSGGNIGIGQILPVNKLDINGSVAIGSYNGVNTAPSNSLIVSGNVGIGTWVPSALLYVSSNINSGSSMVFQNQSSGNNAYAGVQIQSDAGSSYVYRTSSTYNNGGAPSNTTIIQDAASGNIAFYTSANADAQKMILTNSGNLGIGSLTPGQALDVNGTIRALSAGTCSFLYKCVGGIDAGVIQTSACNLCPAGTCTQTNVCV